MKKYVLVFVVILMLLPSATAVTEIHVNESVENLSLYYNMPILKDYGSGMIMPGYAVFSVYEKDGEELFGIDSGKAIHSGYATGGVEIEASALNRAWHDVWYCGHNDEFYFVLIISLLISGVFSLMQVRKKSVPDLDITEKTIISGGHLMIFALLCFIASGMIETSYNLFYLSESGLFVCLVLIFSLVYTASSSLLLSAMTFLRRSIGYNYHLHAAVLVVAGIFYALCLAEKNPVLFGTDLVYIPLLVVLSLLLVAIPYFRGHSLSSGGATYGGNEKTLVEPFGDKNREITLFPPELSHNYSNISLAGAGGVAMVFRAVRAGDGRIVAVKVPINRDETTGRSFVREIGVWKRLSHKNIVRVYSANILPVPYIEMEYIKRSLGDLKYPLPRREALDIISAIAEALSYAHKKGIVHHDIKPGNILLDQKDTPKLTDWGLCRMAHDNFESSNIGFSFVYAAPEQIFPSKYGRPGTGTDIFQAGLIFYEILTGKRPLSGDPIEVYSENAEIDPDFEAFLADDGKICGFYAEIIRKCLRKDPKLRYSSADLLCSDLKKLGDMESKKDGDL